MYLILNQSTSFAEALICDTQNLQVIDTKSFFTASENLNLELPKWIADRKISKAFVCTRHLTKIFDTRLGGSVAQIVDQGLEDWSLLRQPLIQKGFAETPSRSEALGSESLIKSISARTLADGSVQGEVTDSELHAILDELKTRGAKRICINLVHQKKNPSLSQKISQFLESHDFKVFHQHDLPGEDEMARFRHNCLSACLGGTFNEYQESLCKALGLESNQIFFLTSTGDWTTPNESLLTSMLFGWNHAIKKSFEGSDVLYLGFEQWLLIPEKKSSTEWMSQWGPLAVWHQPSILLATQPTLELQPSPEGFSISENDRKFEPGPMCMGRGVRPLLADVLIASNLWPAKNIAEAGKTRFQNQLELCSKESRKTSEQILKNTLEEILTRLSSEVILKSEKSQIVLTGPMAKTLAKLLQKKLEPEIKLIIDKESEFRSAYSVQKMVTT